MDFEASEEKRIGLGRGKEKKSRVSCPISSGSAARKENGRAVDTMAVDEEKEIFLVVELNGFGNKLALGGTVIGWDQKTKINVWTFFLLLFLSGIR